MSYPDMSKSFILDTNASGAAIGVILSQVHEYGDWSYCIFQHISAGMSDSIA